MFYPATSHVSRTYGAPTTGRRKLAVHNENDLGIGGIGGGLPSKTPSRAGGGGKSSQLVPATAARVGLGAKTEGRDRNVLVRQEGGAGGGKGKGKEEEIEPKRLFASSSTLPPSKSLSNLPQIPSARPVPPTKTPARPPPSSRKLPANNLRTPAPATFRISADVSSTPLPSATRRRKSRSSQGSVGGTPVRPTGGDEFRTPAPSGAKWEEGDSLGSIEEVGPDGAIELDVLGEVEEESDCEVEYMPPKVEELPYEPDWEQGPDIMHVARRLQGLPSVIFARAESGPVPPMELHEDPVERVIETDESLEHPIFRRLPPAHLTSKPPKSIIATTSTVRSGTINQPTLSKRPGNNIKPTKPASCTASRTTTPSVPSVRRTMPTSTKTRPPLPKSMAPPPRGSVLAPRPINKNVPVPKASSIKAKSAKQVEEDEELRKALEDVGSQEMVYDFGF